MTKKGPVDSFIHEKMMSIFRLYLVVGGMPAAVQAYTDTNNIQLIILMYKAGINFGTAVYENAIAEELKPHGFKLYYFNSKKQGELDFVIKLNDRATPIEVKSGGSIIADTTH